MACRDCDEWVVKPDLFRCTAQLSLHGRRAWDPVTQGVLGHWNQSVESCHCNYPDLSELSQSPAVLSNLSVAFLLDSEILGNLMCELSEGALLFLKSTTRFPAQLGAS